MKEKKMRKLSSNEVHAALTGILAEFDRVCREHGLIYSIAYGTMIGAIRHKGFIPWDDDVDVFMPRPVYEKFYALVKSGEIKFGEHFVLTEDRGKKAFYPFLKLMDDRFEIKTWSHIEVPYLFIDIFPLDGAPETEKEIQKLHKRGFKYSAIGALARWAVPDKKWAVIMRGLLFPVYLGGYIYGTARASKKANFYAQKNDFTTSKKCSVFCFKGGLSKWDMESENFLNVIDVPFENITVKCISAYDEWLTLVYGDYMKLPPENQRVTHGLQIFTKAE